MATDLHTDRALAAAQHTSFWLDDPAAPDFAHPLVGPHHADLVVVGGGYTGLWTALLARRRDPNLNVIVVEARSCGWAASGRNGGFCSASLTHGLGNALSRWPNQTAQLEALGMANLNEIEADLIEFGIECEFERTGELDVATADWQVHDLRELADALTEHGHDVQWFDKDELASQVVSPTYQAGVWDRDGVAMLHPAKLTWGLRSACLDAGVQIYEGSQVTGLEHNQAGVRVTTALGSVRARKAALATNAFRPLLKRVSNFIVPVYDYALMTEPLSQEQLAAVGWQQRQGIGDVANQFHYYRLTADNRILWGGYDVIYTFNQKVSREHDHHGPTFSTLSKHFFETFPQLEGLNFSHKWGGAIDTCSRFTQFWGGSRDGSVAYVVGYTGLGVGATRFGAQVLLDRLSIEPDAGTHERSQLDMVNSKPLPFPPEPFRYAAIKATQAAIVAADANDGRRNLWLRTLDRLGLGFDS